ncbi:chorismate mutase [Moritella marina ATCC 15381]|uniref:chorismate mutase n=1 Tax=Moritella marina ATCC 15381 TaxID=1202962 RepID=A0A5J6WLV0_MORMI|nr:chorismate mutase [Moritella marina]QFI38494.1 chorismate mutase [Moritella marina ATCC 15381]
MLKIFSTVALLLFSFNSFSAPTPAEIFSTLNLRLSYMEDVALYKANNNKAIEDIQREKLVIGKASQSAEKVGLNKQSVVGFFQTQISAAKAIQYRYRADLLSQTETEKPRDLKTVIRPALIKLGKEINAKLAQYLKDGGTFTAQDWAAFETTIDSRYLKDTDKKALFKALTQIRLK